MMLSFINPFTLLASYIAHKIGADVNSIKFLLTITFGYPIAATYLVFIRHYPTRIAHWFFFITGLLLSLWNFGFYVVHLFVGIISTMATLHLFGPTGLSVALTFIFNMSYLLFGYYKFNYGTYDINWTMSYCVLCLRLIGLSWDYRDGFLPEEQLSDYQKGAAFKELPDLLEIFSFSFLPTTCFVGPQITWRHYQLFINQTLRPAIVLMNRTPMQKYMLNPKLHRTLSRLLTGILFMALHIIFTGYFPMDYMLTDEFLMETNFFYRIGYMAIFSKFLIMRYLSIWLIGEGACVLVGLGCTGRVHVTYIDENASDTKKDASDARAKAVTVTPDVNTSRFRKAAVLGGLSGVCVADCDFKELQDAVVTGRAVVCEADHTRCANISVVRFESATNTDLLVSSFNINTNKWMLEYVYKRLKFLGNKQVSQILTLAFLAIWHGFYSGYYVNFFLEFVIVTVEKDLLRIVRSSIYAPFLYETFGGRVLCTILGKLHITFLLSSPLVAFSLLRFKLWFSVFSSVYFVGFIYLLWPLARPIVKLMFPRENPADSIDGVEKSD